VREEVLKVRRSTGLPDEDPKGSLVETWREEGSMDKPEGKMRDGSVVEDM
jgi:monolysocardiolipin acyltransferase